MIPHASPEANTTLHPVTDNSVQVQFSFIGGTFVETTAWRKKRKKKTVDSIYLISGLQVLEYVNIEKWIGHGQTVTQSY